MEFTAFQENQNQIEKFITLDQQLCGISPMIISKFLEPLKKETSNKGSAKLKMIGFKAQEYFSNTSNLWANCRCKLQIFLHFYCKKSYEEYKRKLQKDEFKKIFEGDEWKTRINLYGQKLILWATINDLKPTNSTSSSEVGNPIPSSLSVFSKELSNRFAFLRFCVNLDRFPEYIDLSFEFMNQVEKSDLNLQSLFETLDISSKKIYTTTKKPKGIAKTPTKRKEKMARNQPSDSIQRNRSFIRDRKAFDQRRVVDFEKEKQNSAVNDTIKPASEGDKITRSESTRSIFGGGLQRQRHEDSAIVHSVDDPIMNPFTTPTKRRVRSSKDHSKEEETANFPFVAQTLFHTPTRPRTSDRKPSGLDYGVDRSDDKLPFVAATPVKRRKGLF